MIYLTNIDLSQNELQNAILQNVIIQNTSTDLNTAKAGQLWFNTETKTFKYCNGSFIKEFATSEIVENKLNKKPFNNIDLIGEDGKINYEYIPDRVKYQLEYISEFNASLEVNQLPAGREPEIGWYCICRTAGNFNPDGTPASYASTNFYKQGDWACIKNITNNIITWTKVNSTESVKSVNNHLGDIYTYQEAWLQNKEYGKGDIVNFEGTLYICINNQPELTEFDVNYWRAITYNIGEGLDYENNTISHSIQHDGGEIGGPNKSAKINFDKMGHIQTFEEYSILPESAKSNQYLSSVTNNTYEWKDPILNKEQLDDSETLVSSKVVKQIIDEMNVKINILQDGISVLTEQLSMLQ